MKNKKFLQGFLTISLVPLVLIGTANYSIDPYGIFKNAFLGSLNQLKVKQENHQRLYKAIEVIRIKPKTIILGTSRATALSAEHPALQIEKPVYNLAMNGSTIYELRRYLEHTIANQPELEKVIVGVDFFAFGSNLQTPPGFKDSRLGQKQLLLEDLKDILFSVDAFTDSIETFSSNLKNNHQENKNPNTDYATDNFIKISKSVIKSYFVREDRYNNYQLSQDNLEELKKIVALCNEHQIELSLIIAPIHASQLEAIYVAGLWSSFEQWKREVVKIAPTWDFSGYNSITTEDIANQMVNYKDSSHYSTKVGDLILNRIFNYQVESIPEDFGVLLTEDNLSEYLEKIRRDRETYLQEKGEQVEFVHDLYRETSS